MSIDTTFRPVGVTALVGLAALQVGDLSSASSTIRVRCLVSAYLTWSFSSGVTAAGAPAAGVPVANTVGMTAGDVAYLEIPYNSWLISNVAAAFEVTPGQGGTGG